MKDKKAVLIIMLCFVLLIAGAAVLYKGLSRNVDTQQIIVHETPQATQLPAEPEATGVAEAPSEEHDHAEDEGVHAPDVTIFDRDGNAVQLSQFFGKPLVLNFWASWCGPCQSEMPDFQAKYNELGDQVNFVMVNVTDGAWETMESATAFIDANGFDFPVFYDTSAEAGLTYQAYSLPTTYFIDAQGHIAGQAMGAIDAETLQKGIDRINP